jgi:hypothetical protein
LMYCALITSLNVPSPVLAISLYLCMIEQAN